MESRGGGVAQRRELEAELVCSIKRLEELGVRSSCAVQAANWIERRSKRGAIISSDATPTSATRLS